jgi:anion transporter
MNAPTLTARPVFSFGALRLLGLPLAFAALLVVCLMPEQAGLSAAGHRMLGVMLFAVILWVTNAVSYPVTAFLITALTALLLGLTPAASGALTGTAAGLKTALLGFSTPAFCLVAAALFLAAAMTITGLDKRIALLVLSKTGARPKRLVLGVILCGLVLSFFVPSPTARVACLVPVVTGVVAALGASKNSALAAALMIVVAQVNSVWSTGIKTAAAQNMVALNFIRDLTGSDVSWLEWFTIAAPLSALLSLILYFLATRLFRLGASEDQNCAERIKAQLAALGPMTGNEKKLLCVSAVLVALWVTEKILHPLDTTTTTLCAVTVLMLPGIGVMDWKSTVSRINWGTLILFGVGISLGSALLSTHAAEWLAGEIVMLFHLESAAVFTVVSVLALFLITVHLGFASATGLAAAIIPIVIAVLNKLGVPSEGIVGLTVILQLVVSFGYILPVNAPQNMIAYSTGTFEAAQFAKFGLIFTVCAYGAFLLFAATYWRWLGLT